MRLVRIDRLGEIEVLTSVVEVHHDPRLDRRLSHRENRGLEEGHLEVRILRCDDNIIEEGKGGAPADAISGTTVMVGF